MLDEECKFPKASDATLLEKLHKNFEKVKRYDKPKLSRTDFGIEHFAGKVVYTITGFLDKNKDTLQDDLKAVCLASSEDIIRALFADSAEATDSRKAALTVGAQFKQQLQQLMSTLSQTSPHYIRCIKPNLQKTARLFDDDLVRAQLRYAGMLETIRIRKLGFPQRYPINDFYDRVSCLFNLLSFAWLNYTSSKCLFLKC